MISVPAVEGICLCFFQLALYSVVMLIKNFLLGKFFEAVSRFNSNVAYSGLLHAVTQDVSYLHAIL